MITKNSKIYLAGHTGLVGSAIFRKLKSNGYKKIYTISHKKLDLKNQSKVYKYLNKIKPDFIFIAAAKVGGIYSNSNYKAEFIHDNLSIQLNLIQGAYQSGVKNLIFLGSSCVYPRMSKQPIKEKYLLSGNLEETNDAYAIAKIAGIKMCESYNKQYGTNYRCLMPTNAFGPNDNYNDLNSHFFPALIKKAHECKIKKKRILEIWGSGKPLRELIFVDDIADACIFFLKKKIKETVINIGTGKDMRIKDYAEFIIKQLKLNIKIKYNKNKPDGTYRKVMNVARAKKFGWQAKVSLKKGFETTYKDFLSKYYK